VSEKLGLGYHDMDCISAECSATVVFMCISHAEARLSYRLDVCPSLCLSVCHTLVLCRNGSTYRHTVFTAW